MPKYISKIVKDNVEIQIKDATARSTKADKVSGATNNNFAALNSNGNLKDSGKNATDLLTPVNINTLTPSSTFVKNNVLGINGVLYRAVQDTSDFPVTLVIEDGHFVTHTVNGKIAFVVSSYTLDSDWEIFTDASVEYWVESLNTRMTAAESEISSISYNIENAFGATLSGITVDGTTYSLSQILTAVAQFMSDTIVHT